MTNVAIDERFRKFLRIVEDLQFFYTLPWGNIMWSVLCTELSVDLGHIHEKLNLKLKKKPDVDQKEAKYTLRGNIQMV